MRTTTPPNTTAANSMAAMLAAFLNMPQAVPTFLPKAKPAPQTTSKPGRCFSIREGSIAWVVMSFFIHNPDEELTSEDAAVKADAQPRKVEQAVAACVRDGYLQATPLPKAKRQQKPMQCYSAGPNLAAAAAHMHSINPNTVPRKPVGT